LSGINRLIIDPKRSGADVVIVSLEGKRLECAIRLAFATTYNEAEYEAIARMGVP